MTTINFSDLRFELFLSLYMSLRRCGFLLSDISGSSNTIWFTITSMSVLTTWMHEDKQESNATKYQFNTNLKYCNNLLYCEVQEVDLLQLPRLIP